MLKLTRRVQRVHVDCDETRAQYGSHGNRILQHVGHHAGDAVTLLQAETLQVRTERTRIGVNLGVGKRLTHAGEGGAGGVLLKALFEQLHDGGVLIIFDRCRYAFGIIFKPRLIHGGLLFFVSLNVAPCCIS